jgi:hypothetical protein
MEISCPACGAKIAVNGLGRTPLNIPVTKVCDLLKRYSSVPPVAEVLGCSRAYVYKVLKANGLTAKDFIRGKK